MSSSISSFGVYGYQPELDTGNLSARQVAQMIWYFIDGGGAGTNTKRRWTTGTVSIEFHTGSRSGILIPQNKKTGRWWMQLPDKKFIACSYNDYLNASHNEIPEGG